DVVAGIRTPKPLAELRGDMPAAYEEFQRIADGLERHYRDVQDLEFTIERGRLYMLQTRNAKRTAAAAVRIATDMVADGIISDRGGATSHAGVVARQIGKPCVAGASDLLIDLRTRTAQANGKRFAEGDALSLDGTTGEVFLGSIPTVSARYEDQGELQTVLGWADSVRRLGVWTNAD